MDAVVSKTSKLRFKVFTNLPFALTTFSEFFFLENKETYEHFFQKKNNFSRCLGKLIGHILQLWSGKFSKFFRVSFFLFLVFCDVTTIQISQSASKKAYIFGKRRHKSRKFTTFPYLFCDLSQPDWVEKTHLFFMNIRYSSWTVVRKFVKNGKFRELR